MCAVADAAEPHDFLDEIRIPTTDPDTTLRQVRDFLIQYGPLEAVAVASFGPLDTDPASQTFGWITTTPKPGWQNTDLRSALVDLCPAPIPFVTDVTGSLLGERARGALVGCDDAAYATVGTGIGVGLMVRGQLVTGRSTPEMGHIIVRRHPDDDHPGVCSYHGDCLEGLASGPAVEARWGRPAEGHQVAIIAEYIAQMCATLALSVGPQRVVVGGGVSKTAGLMDEVRRRAADLVHGYLGDHPIADPHSSFIRTPQLGDHSALHGAMELALGV